MDLNDIEIESTIEFEAEDVNMSGLTKIKSFNYMTNKDLKKYDITLKDVGLTIEKKSFKKIEKTRILHSVNVSFKVKKK